MSLTPVDVTITIDDSGSRAGFRKLYVYVARWAYAERLRKWFVPRRIANWIAMRVPERWLE